MHEYGSALESFWNGLGDGRGYVVGATVTLLGVLLNVLVLAGLEALRVSVQRRHADVAWGREREKEATAWARERAERLEELRRVTYTEIVAACEARRWWDRAPEDRKPEVESNWRGCRAAVRFVTDDRMLIDATDALVNAAGESATQDEFVAARTEFVTRSRAEIGRADLNIKTAPALVPARVAQPPTTQ